MAAIGGYGTANLRLDARASVLDDGGAARCAPWDAGLRDYNEDKGNSEAVAA